MENLPLMLLIVVQCTRHFAVTMADDPEPRRAVTSASFEAAWYVSSTRCTFSLSGPISSDGQGVYLFIFFVFASAHVA